MTRVASALGGWDDTQDRSAHMVLLVFMLALVVKALVMFALFPVVTHLLGSNYHTDLFPDGYDQIAQNLITGHGYRMYPETSETMLRSPGFVLILAAVFALAGKSLLAVQIVQYFMSALTAAIVYLMAQRLFAARWVALIAALIFLFNPVSMMSDTRAGTDTTLTLCLAATLWLLLIAIDSRRPRDFALTGLVLGYTMLVKASVALIFPVVFLFLLRSSTMRARLRLLGHFTIIAVVAALVMAPWVVRNYAISGKFVPTMTVAGLAVFQGEEAERSSLDEDNWQLLEDAAEQQVRIGHEMGLRMRDEFFPQFYTVGDEIAFYRELSNRAWDQYRAHPLLLARVIVHNSWAFWAQGRTGKATLLNLVFMLPFLALCAYGAMLAIRRQRQSWILVIAVVAYVLPHLVIIAVARYSTAVMPMMAVLASGVLLAPATRRAAATLPLARGLARGLMLTRDADLSRSR